MTVYVDRAHNRYGRMVMCHMIADTPTELHEMALAIGMRRDWYQAPPRHSFPHYDLSLTKKAEAISRGAVEITRHDISRIMRTTKLLMIKDRKTWASEGWI